MTRNIEKLSPGQFCELLAEELVLDYRAEADEPLTTPIELDSLASLQVLALFDDCGIDVDNPEIPQEALLAVSTMADLYALYESRLR